MKKKNVKKCIATILATFLATSSLSVVPFAAVLKEDIVTKKPEITRAFSPKVTLPSPTPIKVNEKKSIIHTMEGEFEIPNAGKNKKEVVFLFDTSGIGLGNDDPPKGPLESALFSGGTENLIIHGNDQEVIGNIHSNASIKVDTMSFDCYTLNDKGEKVRAGLITSVYEKETTGTVPLEAFSYNEKDVRDMPDYADKLTEAAEQDGVKIVWINDFIDSNKMDPAQFQNYLNEKFNTLTPPSVQDVPDPSMDMESSLRYLRAYNPGINLMVGSETSKEGKKLYYVTPQGNVPFKIPDNTILRIATDFKVSCGLEFEGTGHLIVDGDIIIQGQNVKTNSVTGADAMIYSRNGDIIFDISNTKYYGIVYAPSGIAELNGDNVQIFGSVSAKKLGSTPNRFTVTYTEGEAKKYIKPDPPLTYFDLAKKEVIAYIESIDSADPVNINVLTYDHEASFIVEGEAPKDNVAITNMINNKVEMKNLGQANLGDGIRVATDILNDEGVASKSIVVISGSAPNYWTKNNKTGGYYFTDKTGKTDISMVDSVDGQKSPSGYAEKTIYSAAQSNIVTLFYNYLYPELIDPDTNELKENDKWKAADTAIRDILNNVINSKPQLKLFKNIEGIDPDNTGPDDFYKSAQDYNLKTFINETLSTISIQYSMDIEVEFSCLLPAAVTIKKSDLPKDFKSEPVGKRTKITSKNVKTTLFGVLDTKTNKVTYSVDDNDDLKVFNDLLLKDLKFLYNKDIEIDKKSKGIETRVFEESDADVTFTIKSVTGYTGNLSFTRSYKDLTLRIKYIDLN